MQKAVTSIFNEVGAISKISPVYASPAMGFEGPEFLNCVLSVQTMYSASQTLEVLQSIEKRLGRNEKTGANYTSRTIDIDILLYSDEIIKNKSLEVPHPRFPQRLFVLQPFADIHPTVVHPVLNKTIQELIETTSDSSLVTKQSKWLRNPQKDFDVNKFNYIAIEGNIGAGKTSLAHLMATDFNAKLILERFKDNPFLPKFYEDPARYAFPLEMSFLADRYQQLLDDIKQFDLFKDCVIADYDAYKSMIFALITLQEEEFVLYKKLFNLMYKELAKPDVYVYLFQNTERLLANIKTRGRSYEHGIEASYLEQINQGYLDYIKSQHNLNVKMIDISEMDFVENRSDYIAIVRQILQD